MKTSRALLGLADTERATNAGLTAFALIAETQGEIDFLANWFRETAYGVNSIDQEIWTKERFSRATEPPFKGRIAFTIGPDQIGRVGIVTQQAAKVLQDGKLHSENPHSLPRLFLCAGRVDETPAVFFCNRDKTRILAIESRNTRPLRRVLRWIFASKAEHDDSFYARNTDDGESYDQEQFPADMATAECLILRVSSAKQAFKELRRFGGYLDEFTADLSEFGRWSHLRGIKLESKFDKKEGA